MFAVMDKADLGHGQLIFVMFCNEKDCPIEQIMLRAVFF